MQETYEIIDIDSAFDFFKIVHNINMYHFDSGERSYIQYFRGQSNCEWGVTPLIHRAPDFSLFNFEKEMVQDFISRRPAEFKDIANSFNLIAKMQHYGLATRLVDMTTNPAVALFFACNHHPDKDGEIFMFTTKQEEILNPRILDMIVRFYLDEKDSGYNLYQYYQKCLDLYHKEELDKGFYFMIANMPMGAITEWVSERMIRQSSTFIIVPFHAENEIWPKEHPGGDNLMEYLQENGYEEYLKATKVIPRISDIQNILLKYHQKNKRFLVRAENKKEILRHLKTIGVYESLIFPELEYEGKGIVNEYLYLTEQSTN